jgi:hypothetical protein
VLYRSFAAFLATLSPLMSATECGRRPWHEHVIQAGRLVLEHEKAPADGALGLVEQAK